MNKMKDRNSIQFQDLKLMEEKEIRISQNDNVLRCTQSGKINDRKHGYLISKESTSNEAFVFLSDFDVVIQAADAFIDLRQKRYTDLVFDGGLSFLSNMEETKNSINFYYTIGCIEIKKSILLLGDGSLNFEIEYLQGPEANFSISPFLAFRNIYSLNQNNHTEFSSMIGNYRIVIKSSASDADLHLECNKKFKYTELNQWYNNITYHSTKHLNDQYENLFVPGSFDFKIEAGENIIFNASLNSGDGITEFKLHKHYQNHEMALV